MSSYSGFKPERTGWVPFRINPNEDGAKAKFRRAVAMRMPVIFTDLLPDVNKDLGNIDVLKKEAGDCTVFVEHGQQQKERVEFGTGKKHPMRFGAMLEELEKGKNHLYLTTVPLEEDEDGLNKEFFSTPLTHLTKYFAMSPSIAAPLALSTINLWLGNSKEGSSSNLHHDFHDNIYLLLEGKKRFLIAAPDETEKMYPHGSVATIHPNGLINYFPVLTRPDGHPLESTFGSDSDDDDGSAFDEGSDDAEDSDIAEMFKELEGESDEDGSASDVNIEELLGGSISKNGKGNSGKVTKRDDEHQEDSAEDSGDDEDDEEEMKLLEMLQDGEGVEDDFDAIASDVMLGEDDSDDSEDDSSEEAMLAEEWAQFDAKRKGKQVESAATKIPDHFSQIPIPKIRALVMKKGKTSEEKKKPVRKRAREPEFGDEANLEIDDAIVAEIEALQAHSIIKKEFPEFQKAVMTIVELRKGECLYLPAGWWHEVTSYCAEATGKKKDKLSPHIALNYWFHPPSRWAISSTPKKNKHQIDMEERSDNPDRKSVV